jgi:hypothetical protein
LLKLARTKWLTRLLKYIADFKRRPVFGKDSHKPLTYFKEDFFLTEACDELMAYFTEKFNGPDGKAQQELMMG